MEYQVELLKRELLKKRSRGTQVKKIYRTGRGRYKKRVICLTYALIQEKSASYSIVELCREHEASRSGYYK